MKKLLVSTTVLLIGAAGAQAQDYHSGYYARLDSGWSWAQDAEFKDNDFNNSGVICGDPQCNTAGTVGDIGDSYIIGGGIGYRFSNLIRGDATFAYRGGYELDDRDANDTTFQGDITSWSFMANGYFDLPVDLGIFKPYVGAGLGFATVRFDDIVIENSAGLVAGGPSGSTTNFAWQLMAGTTVDLSRNVALDIGYRYFDGGSIKADAGLATGALAGVPYQGSEGDLKAHELTVGLRYDF